MIRTFALLMLIFVAGSIIGCSNTPAAAVVPQTAAPTATPVSQVAPASQVAPSASPVSQAAPASPTASSATAVSQAAPASPAAPSVTAAPSSQASASSPSSQSDVTVEANDDFFRPEKITITAGTKVTWINVGTKDHTVTYGTLFDQEIKTGETFSYTFDKPGVYQYYCTTHSESDTVGMVGTITVSPK